MCLAEALLRIPDAATRDALIRDKLAPGDWRAHVGHSPSLFVNAATWGLVLTGRLVTTTSEQSLVGGADPPDRPRRRADHPRRRRRRHAADGRAVRHRPHDRGGARRTAATREARGFSFSYDMLGEAATTAEDAARYYAEYEHAIHAIGKASRRPRHLRGPGHLDQALGAASALSARIKRARVMSELLPRVKALAGARANPMTSASTSTPRRPIGSNCRSICWRRCASTRSSPAGTASASSSRPTASAARRSSTG